MNGRRFRDSAVRNRYFPSAIPDSVFPFQGAFASLLDAADVLSELTLSRVLEWEG